MSDTVVNALGLGVAAVIASILASSVVMLLSRWLDGHTRLATIIFVMAGVIAMMELAMRAWLPELRISLGVFLPLVVANLAIVQLLHDHDSIQPNKMKRAFMLSVTAAAGLVVLGIARELVGRGSILHDAQAVFGAWAGAIDLVVFRVDMGFLLAMLPPGAFISLGLLLAIRNWIVRKVPSGV
jgi:electron transport complex protein RnfE